MHSQSTRNLTISTVHAGLSNKPIPVLRWSKYLTRRSLLQLFSVLFCLRDAKSALIKPKRIVSVAPSITEMLYSLGLGDRVVGVTTHCHYPPEVRQKHKIGDYMNPNFESILAIKTDLVVTLKEHRGLIQKLRSFGLPFVALQHNDLAGIYQSLLDLGEATHTPGRALEQVTRLRSELATIRQQASKLRRRSVMFVIGRTPATVEDVTVVGSRSFLNELITIAGGKNVLEDTLAHYPRIPREELYARNPEVIIDMGNMGNTVSVTEDHRVMATKLWKQLPELSAVRTGRVYVVSEDIFVVPGLRVAETARRLVAMIHPEVTQ